MQITVTDGNMIFCHECTKGMDLTISYGHEGARQGDELFSSLEPRENRLIGKVNVLATFRIDPETMQLKAIVSPGTTEMRITNIDGNERVFAVRGGENPIGTVKCEKALYKVAS